MEFQFTLFGLLKIQFTLEISLPDIKFQFTRFGLPNISPYLEIFYLGKI